MELENVRTTREDLYSGVQITTHDLCEPGKPAPEKWGIWEFCGPDGVGKSCLIHSIAGELVAKGRQVVIKTAVPDRSLLSLPPSGVKELLLSKGRSQTYQEAAALMYEENPPVVLIDRGAPCGYAYYDAAESYSRFPGGYAQVYPQVRSVVCIPRESDYVKIQADMMTRANGVLDPSDVRSRAEYRNLLERYRAWVCCASLVGAGDLLHVYPSLFDFRHKNVATKLAELM